MDYEANYCSNCVHGQNEEQGCPVLGLHMLWNYDACNGKSAEASPEVKAKFIALDSFIPRDEKGWNGECAMFHPTGAAEKEMVVDKTDALKEWEAIYGKRVE